MQTFHFIIGWLGVLTNDVDQKECGTSNTDTLSVSLNCCGSNFFCLPSLRPLELAGVMGVIISRADDRGPFRGTRGCGPTCEASCDASAAGRQRVRQTTIARHVPARGRGHTAHAPSTGPRDSNAHTPHESESQRWSLLVLATESLPALFRTP